MICAECYLIVLALVKKKEREREERGKEGRQKERRRKEGKSKEREKGKKERKKKERKKERFAFAESMWNDKRKFLCGVL